ncbi:MAG: hypothetical protein AAFZ65_11855 [Planctomycetota bacterium]
MSQDPIEPLAGAQDAFMDALLARGAEPQAADSDAIEAALADLRASEATRPRSRWMAAAASVLVAVGALSILVGGPGVATAEAALSTAIEGLRTAGPRAYALSIERDPSLRRSIAGTLYADGEHGFALELDGLRGRELWAGGSDLEHWVVPALSGLPVVLFDDPAQLLEALDEYGVSLPYVDPVAMLEACARDFELTLSDGGRTVRGERRPASEAGPERFELELDAGGMLRELRLEGDAVRAIPGRTRLSLSVTDEAVDPAVLERTSHHEPDRLLIRR